MPRLLVTALAAAAVLATPVLAGAAPAPAPQIVDPSGDAVGTQSSLDIVSVKFSTTGTTTVIKKGKKKITVYTPTKLVVTETLAAAPSTQAPTRYRIQAEIDGCGSLDLIYANGADGPVGSLWLDCPEGDASDPLSGGTLLDVTPKIKGNALTWEFSLKSLPKQVKVGSVISGFRAYTDAADPLTGLIGTGDGASALLNLPTDPTNGKAVVDSGSGTAVWKIA
ncbi:MAG: hypothetical protein QOE45_241 [Frankiaceae bacterium]|jgi:hypothetical protein|nr:hypothetical protein [Frankiaceae bacterium]